MVKPSKNQQGPNPYKGIHPFEYSDSDTFFGRDSLVEECFAKASVNRVLLLYGESGTGKSSLLNAGVIPFLKKEGLQPEKILMRPDPEAPLLICRIRDRGGATAPFLPSIFSSSQINRELEGQNSAFEPKSIKTFLSEIERHYNERDGLIGLPVLIFDQFEELFTLFGRPDAANRKGRSTWSVQGASTDRGLRKLREEILEMIARLAREQHRFARIIISVREDYLGSVQELELRYPRIFDSLARTLRFDHDAALEAITGPFKLVTSEALISRISNGAAEAIIADLASSNGKDAPSILPTHIQIICGELWERFSDKTSEIGREHYEDSGGAAAILESFARRVLDKVRDCIPVLEHLVTDSGTRDVVSFDILKDVAHMKEPELTSVLGQLERDRIINTLSQRDNVYYEIASQYLIPPIVERVEQLRARRHLVKRIRWIVLIIAAGLLAWAVAGTIYGLLETQRANQAERTLLQILKHNLVSRDYVVTEAVAMRLLRQDPNNEEALTAYADALFHLGKFDELEDALSRWNNVSEGRPQQRLLAAELASQRGNYEGAVRLWTEYLRLPDISNVERKAATIKLAKVHEGAGNWTRASSTLRQSSEIDDIPLLLDLAYSELNLKHWDEALATVQRANRMSPADPRVRAILPVYEKLEKNMSVISDLDARAQGSWDALLERAALFRDLQLWELACEDLAELLSRVEGQETTSDLGVRMKNELRASAESNPEIACLWFLYGKAAFRSRSVDESVRALEKAVSLKRSDEYEEWLATARAERKTFK